MTESPRESKSACKYEKRRRSRTGCRWESDQGECLRLFGRSPPRDFSVQSCLLVNSLTLSWTPNLVIMDMYTHTHTHTRAIAFRPLRAFCSHELNDARRKAVGDSLDFRPKMLHLKITRDRKLTFFFLERSFVCRTNSWHTWHIREIVVPRAREKRESRAAIRVIFRYVMSHVGSWVQQSWYCISGNLISWRGNPALNLDDVKRRDVMR